ncbi:MAG: aminotransferase class V-fold PLP-dependent enzyme [Promethearchaeia archaeon]
MNINWENIRKNQFPSLKNQIHMKAAGGSPMCKSAYSKGTKYFRNIYKKGDIFWDHYFKEMEEARELVADYLNSNTNEISFLINTSSGINIISHLLNQGTILYPEGEFPSSILPFKLKDFNCIKIRSKNKKYRAEDIEETVHSNHDYLIQSYVQYLTGFKQELGKIGRITYKNKVIYIINATQAFGALPLDVKRQKIDILVASGLKWACCGYGAAILYVKEKILEDKNLPCLSWLSVRNKFAMDNDNTDVIKQTKAMDSFGGTPNFPALMALKGSLELIKDIGAGDINVGIREIYKRIKFLTNKFIRELQDLGHKIISPLDLKYRSGIITMQHQNAKAIYKELLKNNIHISLRNYPSSQNKDLLRFALHYYNNLEDIRNVVSVLKRCG